MSTSIPNTGLGLSETAALDSAPGDLLRQAKRLLDHAQDLVDQAVIAERVKGTSWEAIGTALDGVTKSAVQKRFGGRVSEWTKEFEREELPFEPMAPAFPTAWRQLAFHWAEADRIIHAQEHIAALTNATAAASGTDFNNGECEGFDTAGLAAALSVFAEVASRSTFPGGSRREVLTAAELDNLGTHRGRRVADTCLACAARSPEKAQSPGEDSQEAPSGRLDQLEQRMRELEETTQQLKALTRAVALRSEVERSSEDQQRAAAGTIRDDIFVGHGRLSPGVDWENTRHPDEVIARRLDAPHDAHSESDRR